jgi:lipoate-protein ligase B
MKLRELVLKESETKYHGFGIFVRTGMSEFVSTIPSGLPDTRYQHMTIRNQAGNLHIFNVYFYQHSRAAYSAGQTTRND